MGTSKKLKLRQRHISSKYYSFLEKMPLISDLVKSLPRIVKGLYEKEPLRPSSNDQSATNQCDQYEQLSNI